MAFRIQNLVGVFRAKALASDNECYRRAARLTRPAADQETFRPLGEVERSANIVESQVDGSLCMLGNKVGRLEARIRNNNCTRG